MDKLLLDERLVERCTNPKPAGGETNLQYLVSLQRKLTQHYDVELPYCISGFVCHNPIQLQQFTGSKVDYSSTPEMLIYQQDGDDLDITLFLNPDLFANIDHDAAPQQPCSAASFNNTCIVLEGVSHFIYLTWNAHHDRQISHLDMELQAEVDKFIYTVLDSDKPDNSRSANSHLKSNWRESNNQLLKRLYSEIRYRPELSDTEKARYEKANELAYIYCSWLCRHFNLAAPNRKLSAELSRFYRLNGLAKQRHITCHLH